MMTSFCHRFPVDVWQNEWLLCSGWVNESGGQLETANNFLSQVSIIELYIISHLPHHIFDLV